MSHRYWHIGSLGETSITPDGELLLHGSLVPTLVSIDLENLQAGFQKSLYLPDLMGQFIAFDKENILYGDFRLNLAHHGEDETFKLTSLERFDWRFKDSASVGSTTVNYTVMNSHGNSLVIAYPFSSEFVMIERNSKLTYKKVGITFPGYQPREIEWKRELNSSNQKYFEFMNSFHRILYLRWHQGILYGFFRRGYDGYGIWTQLYPKPSKAHFYDNNKNNKKLIGVGESSFMFGEPHESEEGVVTWCFSSKPSFN